MKHGLAIGLAACLSIIGAVSIGFSVKMDASSLDKPEAIVEETVTEEVNLATAETTEEVTEENTDITTENVTADGENEVIDLTPQLREDIT